MTRALSAALVVLALTAPRGEAAAQTCAGGRITTQEGYCCWPGQRWDASAGRCDGPPRCPSPLAASGSECVDPRGGATEPPPRAPAMVSAAGPIDYGAPGAAGALATSDPRPPAASVAAPSALGASWPSMGRYVPAGARNPFRETRSSETVQVYGIALLLIGYAGSVGLGSAALTSAGLGSSRDRSCHEALGAISFVPLVGGFLALPVVTDCQIGWDRLEWAWGLGVIPAAMQLVGFGLLLAGTLAVAEVTVFENASLRLTVEPLVGGTTGFSARLRL